MKIFNNTSWQFAEKWKNGEIVPEKLRQTMAGDGYDRATAKIQFDYLCMHCSIDFRR